MKRETVLNILIALLVSMAGAYGMAQAQLSAIDTREDRNNLSQQREIDQVKFDYERAIERVQADATARIDRAERDWSRSIEKIDANVQWLIRREVERDARRPAR